MKTTTQFQVEQINYDLILKLQNLNNQEKNLLLGNQGKYVAVKKSNSVLEAMPETIGKRDECTNTLKKLLNEAE
ncbi:MAG: hypothetical protein EAZ85_04805 [Bacteroidetes bacterium]|nr:MAG: hypothetical protein EAZ85_04805 [Bacteroidota bacterium]TAG88253.1 MAG: hypothetical protein EAZ20_08955 [Bacteroidota bacterium]